MRRRSFIVLLGTPMTLWPFAATAERPQRVWRIGVLMTYSAPNSEARVFAQTFLDAFQQRLQELAWIAGRNAEIDVRWAPADSLRGYSAELVRLSPDVLVGTDTPNTKALRDATQTIPIVFVTLSDPVGTGLISNLAGPEGNLTGFTDFEYSMRGKSLELLKDIAPTSRKSTLSLTPTLHHLLSTIFGRARRGRAPVGNAKRRGRARYRGARTRDCNTYGSTKRWFDGHA